MKISIITPVLNEIRVTRTLDSILSQSHEHELEIIVVDGGSTDGTLEALEGYRDRISTLISEPDDGIYYAMNKGIRHATGDVVGILNSDDYYIDDLVIQDVMAAFADEETDACYGDIVCVDNDEEFVSYWRAGPARYGRIVQGYLVTHWVPPHPPFFVRRSVYERYGLFRLDIPLAADSEFMLRVIYKGNIKLKYVDRALVRFNVCGRSSTIFTGNKFKPPSEIVRVWRAHYKYRWLLFLFAFPLYNIVITPIWRKIKPLLIEQGHSDAPPRS